MRTLLALVFLSPAALSQSVLYSVKGNEESSFGGSLDVFGDVDFDGVSDLVVGAPAEDGVGHLAGVCHVLSGASGATLYSIQGGALSTFTGYLVSRLGDVNGDGLPDFFVLSEENQSTSSRLSVRSGVDGTVLYDFVDPELNYISAADDLGDVDGDGIADFIVSNFGYPNATYHGRVLVRSGADGSPIYTYTGGQGSTQGQSSLGRAVAGTGDLDGDGRGDFAFSSLANGGYRVDVRSGATGDRIYVWKEPLESHNFGSLLCSAGDVDADGVPDLLVGRRQQYLIAGELHVYSGATGDRLYTVQGLCQGTYAQPDEEIFPEHVAALGDVNGDGYGDFGAVGVAGFYARVYSGVDGSVLADLFQPPNLTFGNGALSIGGGADLDLDGVPEVLVGHPTYATPGTSGYNMGRVRAYKAIDVKQLGTALALGDGSGAPCPCGNTGQAGAGCANSTGLGAVLTAWGSRSVASDDLLWFRGEHVVGYAETLLIASPVSLAGGLGIPFANGLLACGAATRRVWPNEACPSGLAVWGSGLSDQGGWSAGDTRIFQAWYRDTSGPCGGGSNLSNAVQIQFVP